MNAFGRYEIVRRIGVGGMGEVYFAWAYGVARTRKPVVVKVLRAEMLSEPGALEMFVEEGRLSLNLSHSNVLQVFDFGKADDRYFMAMEFVDGFHLGELKRRAGGMLEPDLACFIAMEVCLGLDYAHRLRSDEGAPLQIVHRDVTPSNVLISREGEVKLADFGIARATGRSQHTQAGQIRGKVRYMSPEAARGEPLDHRADLFSLGAVLFELLTGKRVFDAKGGREQILLQIVSGIVPAPSSIDEDVPKTLDAVVLKAMAAKREDRFSDAFAMHRALEEACRAAGLYPSRGRFLEFLRELDVAVAAAEANSWNASSIAGSPAGLPGVTPADGRRGALTVTPSRQRSTPATPTAAVVPPVWPSTEAPAGPTAAGGPGVPGAAPLANSSRPSRPSSHTGAVPPPAVGPEMSVMPTGVASPVLFTLTIAEPERPLDRPSSDGTPILPDLAHFEVTKFEIDAPSADALDALDAGLVGPLDDVVDAERTLPPLDRTTDRAVQRPPDRLSGPTEATEIAPPKLPVVNVPVVTAPVVTAPVADAAPPIAATAAMSGARSDDFAADPNSGEQSRWRVRPRHTPVGAATQARADAQAAAARAADSEEADYPALATARRPRVPGGRVGGPVAAAVAVLVLVAILGALIARERRRDDGRLGSLVTPTPTGKVTSIATGTPAPAPTTTALVVRSATPARTARPTPARTATPAPTVVAAASFGLLDVNSDPWAEVRLGGRLLGNTPLVKLRLPVGRHTLSFRNPRSGVVKNVEVDVRSGENGPVLVQLSP